MTNESNYLSLRNYFLVEAAVGGKKKEKGCWDITVSITVLLNYCY